MKALLIAESREGKILGSYTELVAFAIEMQAETVMFVVGDRGDLPSYSGRLYFADASRCGEFNPDTHKKLLLEVIAREQPDMVIFSHSSYGWDLAPRIACAIQAAQVSEVVAVVNGKLVVPFCNAKLRRQVSPVTARTVVTVQAGAFTANEESSGSPELVELAEAISSESISFLGYEAAEKGGVDLSKAEVIVSAGRGVGKAENVGMIAALAEALGGQYGASRPVVDAGWVEHNRQVGTTGQAVSPRLYIACGISGAIQHLAGMKKSEFIVAVNTDRDAPIAELADVLVVADLKQFVPMLTEKIQALR